MSSEQPWTIERICASLGAPTLTQRFLTEINKAPAHELLPVFAKWERVAKDIESSLADKDEFVAAARRGEDPPGEWLDGDERMRQATEEIRSRGVA
ncbi:MULTISPECIES: hypothetical protein [Streptomyces]|uniref:Uncharacterized protein n=1 Tax=Streptomyces cacaoi TaxID=1898 RepID=A0A4Y3QVE1_STRCI|nr:MULTISPECIES: hypothetical protein [Streptomyces]NNG85727.1 hypothetical protein [Streptomyces cacaoi]GEB49315.1 hypothetical protein SCA03_18660 [Streptomyces cacaoi]